MVCGDERVFRPCRARRAAAGARGDPREPPRRQRVLDHEDPRAGRRPLHARRPLREPPDVGLHRPAAEAPDVGAPRHPPRRDGVGLLRPLRRDRARHRGARRHEGDPEDRLRGASRELRSTCPRRRDARSSSPAGSAWGPSRSWRRSCRTSACATSPSATAPATATTPSRPTRWRRMAVGSSSAPTTGRWAAKGFVTEFVTTLIEGNRLSPGDYVFTCGPVPMFRALQTILERSGHSGGGRYRGVHGLRIRRVLRVHAQAAAARRRRRLQALLRGRLPLPAATRSSWMTTT